jgi:hypothetical protein
MKLVPMPAVDTALTWMALDFAEGESKTESLAAKFKTKDIANRFANEFNRCREKMKNASSTSGLRQRAAEDDEGATGGDEEEYVDEELFRKQVTMCYMEDGHPKKIGTGDIVILPCETMGAYCVMMESNNGTVICKHIICSDHSIAKSKKKKFAEWTAQNYADMNNVMETVFHVQFSSEASLDQFVMTFKEGIENAKVEQLDSNNPKILEELTVAGGGEEEEDEDDVLWTAPVNVAYLGENGQQEDKGAALLSIISDDDLDTYRLQAVSATDNTTRLCNHIICKTYTVEKSSKKLYATWMAKDFSMDEPVRRKFKLSFDKLDHLETFLDFFKQGVGLANDNDINEQPDNASVTGELLVPEPSTE